LNNYFGPQLQEQDPRIPIMREYWPAGWDVVR